MIKHEGYENNADGNANDIALLQLGEDEIK